MPNQAAFALDAVPLPDLAQAFPDILTLLRRRAVDCPEVLAIEDVTGGGRSYSALLTRVETIAAQLITEWNRPGRPRIAIVMPNGGTLSETLLAATVVGTALPFNPEYTPHEFDSYFRETEIDFLVTLSSFNTPARKAATQLGLKVLDLDRLSAPPVAVQLATPAPDDTAMVLLTSGSTGRAKRVPLTHRNVCTSARDVSVSLRLTPSDRCLSMWELYHVGGLVDLLLAPLHSGGTVIATQGFEAAQFFDILSTRKPTWYQGVPTALGELALLARRNGFVADGSSLRFLRSVAAALSPALMAEIEALFGVPVLQTFGMTEASPLICSTGFDAADRIPGSVGRSYGTKIGIFNDTWQRQGGGVEGEVAIQGPNVFHGYEADPEANAAAFREGWFRTGDLGRLDAEGRLFLTGRIKELVNRGGEKVNLREVDDALLTHAAVFEAASFPVPHRTLGEDVAACVVLRPGAIASESEIRAALADRLAAFKIPRRILFLASLPRNAVGKIDRRQLATDAIERLEAEAALTASNGAEPTSDAEARIAAIWAQELGLPSVGPEDDFGVLGGDSLAGLRVLVALEAAFGLSLPDDTLAQISTVRAMTELVAERGTVRKVASALVEGGVTAEELRQIKAVVAMGRVPVLRDGSLFKIVNRDGNRKPLIWFFNYPAKEMVELHHKFPPDYPLFGGFSGGKIFDMSDATMVRLARQYAAEIASEFPDGSFILGGNCKGGLLAWEVAKQLQAKGREVERLCLMEYSSPELARFDGPLLMMFKKQSRQKAYREIGWGKEGWERAFPRIPTTTWIEGAHGGSFRRGELQSFLYTLLAFLNDTPVTDGTLETVAGRRILRIHQSKLLFGLFRAASKISSRLRYGRSAKFAAFRQPPAVGSSKPR